MSGVHSQTQYERVYSSVRYAKARIVIRIRGCFHGYSSVFLSLDGLHRPQGQARPSCFALRIPVPLTPQETTARLFWHLRWALSGLPLACRVCCGLWGPAAAMTLDSTVTPEHVAHTCSYRSCSQLTLVLYRCASVYIYVKFMVIWNVTWSGLVIGCIDHVRNVTANSCGCFAALPNNLFSTHTHTYI